MDDSDSEGNDGVVLVSRSNTLISPPEAFLVGTGVKSSSLAFADCCAGLESRGNMLISAPKALLVNAGVESSSLAFTSEGDWLLPLSFDSLLLSTFSEGSGLDL